MPALWSLPALTLHGLLTSREISAEEILDAVLSRIDAVNPRVNALVTPTPELARDQARAADAAIRRGDPVGPLHGIPVTVKDLTEVAGVRTTYGSTFFADHIPATDAALVARLKAAGCVILGKTNTPEFGGKFDTENRVFGATHNPWHLAHSPGGSSGGAAAAVATGMGPIAHGNDGGGSIRVPAACCGVFGLKPQFGRIPFWPRVEGWAGLNHEGPLARTVRDAAALLDALAGPDLRDPNTLPPPTGSYLAACDGDLQGLRIAWSPTLGYGRVDPQVREACARAALAFETFGARVDEVDPGLEKPEFIFTGTTLPRLLVQFERILPPGFLEQLDPDLAPFLPFVEGMSVRDVIGCEFDKYGLWDRLVPLFERYDLLLTPVMATTAQLSGQFGPQEIDGRPIESALEPFFTYPFNLTGQPAASLPVGFDDRGLPIGLQVVGRRFDEATVLRAAACFEAAHPWHDRWPAL